MWYKQPTRGKEMKKIKVVSRPAVLCPVTGEHRDPSACDSCDAFKGTAYNKDDEASVMCIEDELHLGEKK